MTRGSIVSLQRTPKRSFSKQPCETLELIAGIGARGDVHAGAIVRHASRADDPEAPNLRQIHLFANERLRALRELGYDVHPGTLGDNITTEGLELDSLPTGAVIRIESTTSAGVLLSVTGRRNPCAQIEAFQKGLLKEMIDASGELPRYLCGVMCTVVYGGEIQLGAKVEIALPPGPPIPLERV